MPDPTQSPTPSFARPSARVGGAPMPIQRGNYGIPPRQSQPAPVSPQPQSQPAPLQATSPAPQFGGPRTMDVTAPVRPAPQAVSQAAPVAQVAPAAPVAAAAPHIPTPPRPLFTSAPVQAAPAEPKRAHPLLPKLRLAVLILATLLTVGGLGRWMTAGSTANNIIAVGAVSANDGRVMTIQFTADDGKMHKFTSKSDPKMIPGTAAELAYRSGAPEASVRRVAVIANTRNLGLSLFLLGILLFSGLGIAKLVQSIRYKNKQHATPLTTHVTA